MARKAGQIVARGASTWLVRVYLGRDPQTGTRKSGKAIGHWGGRLLWHLSESDTLFVRWRSCSPAEADAAETSATNDLKAAYNHRRPYANLVR
jgi:hypothetical protein